MNDTVQTSRESEKRQNVALESVRSAVYEELKTAIYPVDVLLAGKSGPLTEEQKQALQTTRAALQRLARAAEKTTPPVSITLKKK